MVTIPIRQIDPAQLPGPKTLSPEAEAGIRETQRRIEMAIAGWDGPPFRIVASPDFTVYGTPGL